MRLNDLKPAPGSKKARTRVGRGASSGQGKTAGRGTKGQHARAGGFHKVGFEGGQMPLQRRLPKIGFRSRKASTRDEVRVHELARIDGDVTLEALKAAGIVPQRVERVKIIASGTLERPVKVVGVPVTRGAKTIIEAAGGSVE
ncbi:MAG TPA: 50S ribosomal protein L15 [Gammaproteobacteria bacterium]